MHINYNTMTTTSATLHNDVYQSNLLELIWPYISQVTRDDLTGQRKRITPDQADWSVLCCSLGPLYSFLMLVCVPILNSTPLSCASAAATAAAAFPATTNTSTIDSTGSCRMENISAPSSTNTVAVAMDNTHLVSKTDASNKSLQSEFTNYRIMAFDLLSQQYDLVVGRKNSNEVDSNGQNAGIDYTMDRLIISQRRFWITLVNNLLDLTNRLLPTCDETFQQNNILPWLFNLAEMNNALPRLDLRMELANHLFTVFSTAAYSVQNEQSILQWLVPGLDRIRLDLIECGDNRRVREVEQFLTDLYSSLRLNDQGRPICAFNSSVKDTNNSVRSSVSTRWSKLTSFNSSNTSTMNSSGGGNGTTGGSNNNTAASTTITATITTTTTTNISTPTTLDHSCNSPPQVEAKKSQSRTKNSRFTFRKH
ncbi:unnamed protein product [Heterobilharzia americana]|nr:unnamed protein product [Heterobilharzia americana]